MFWFDFNWQIAHVLNQFWWPINIGLLIIVVLAGYLASKKPAWAVSLIIICLPTYLFRSRLAFLPITFLELLIWVVFVSFTIANLIKHKIKRGGQYPYRAAIILILVGATIGMIIAPNKIEAAGLWKAYFIEPIMFFVLLYNIWPGKKNQKIILWSLGISALPIALLAIDQKFTGFGIYEPAWTAMAHRRVTSIFSSPNAVGLYLAPIVAIYFGWLLSEIKKIWPTVLKASLILISLVAIFFTWSEGTWLGLTAALIFMLFFGVSQKKTVAAVLIIFIIGLLAISLQPSLLSGVVKSSSSQNRLELWQMANNYLTASPTNFVAGAGILGFAKIQNQWRDPLKLEPLLYPHNIILNFWVEIGLIGLTGMALLMVQFFKSGIVKIKTDKWLTLGIMAAMITIIIHGLIDVPYFKNDLAILFWLIIAIL
ncbi:MAG: O-antigen ligase family protein [Patescibacteria group bacterium]|nr:O-antigen ligase family protein [Patescibacteria group bacterium]